MFLRVAIAAVYIFVFYAVDVMLGKVEESVNVIGSTIIFGLIGSLIAVLFKLPDILESTKNILFGIYDGIRIIVFKKGISYKRNVGEGKIE